VNIKENAVQSGLVSVNFGNAKAAIAPPKFPPTAIVLAS
jgi:hypothetical protein